MQIPGLHPSIGTLMTLQLGASLRRCRRNLRKPQYLASAAIAAALIAAWLGVAALSAQWRQTADPELLRDWIAWAMTGYVAWHLLRTACFRPEAPLEQTDHVRQLMETLPLRGRDRVTHQLASMSGATLVKAGMLALLLSPDLPHLLWGWIGLALALAAVELLRTLVEMFVWSLSRSSYACYRAVVAGGLTLALVAAAPTAQRMLSARLPGRTAEGASTAEASLTQLMPASTVAVRRVWAPVLSITLTRQPNLATARSLAGCFALLAGLAVLAAAGCEAVQRRVRRRELVGFERRCRSQRRAEVASPAERGQPNLPCAQRRLPKPLLGGAGALGWRQWQGARRHMAGILVAFAPPAALALSTIPASRDAEVAFLSVVCALAFYTFLLLPTALKFYFRRDLDRIGMLKALPLGSHQVAIAQLAAPTLLATGFQVAVLAVSQALRPVPWILPLAAAVLLGLLNLSVFALDNVAFLKFPHRLQQEGLTVLFRTMLTFAAKGLLFAAALAATLGWQALSARIAGQLAERGIAIGYGWIFLAGMAGGFLASIGLLVHLLARTLDRFDPAEHLPAS